jgi:GNAT superfamily N-acetyltransferase
VDVRSCTANLSTRGTASSVGGCAFNIAYQGDCVSLRQAASLRQVAKPSMKNLVLASYNANLAEELLSLWRQSFEHGVGITDPHPLQEQRAFFLGQVLPKNSVRIALEAGSLVGFIAATPESVSQLYVRVSCLGHGVGSLLLHWAKEQSNGSLWLYTFAQNTNARRFYEKHGFKAVAYGFEPTWKLEDVKYEWLRSGVAT